MGGRFYVRLAIEPGSVAGAARGQYSWQLAIKLNEIADSATGPGMFA